MSSEVLRSYRSGASLKPGTPGTITITVGTSEPLPSWAFPKTLLAERSHVFNSLFKEDTKISEKHFPNIKFHAFANFADYIRSSIYTANTQVIGYNAIHAHVDACILGAQLGAEDYRRAALRSLHNMFAEEARSPNCNATRSSICAADIQYVCERAGAAILIFAPCITDTAAMMRGLRFLCYDALASHWTQRNVIFFSASRSSKRGWGIWRAGSEASSSRQVPPLPPPIRSTWGALFERFPELRERIVKTSNVMGIDRLRLLRRVEEYHLVFGDVQSETSGFSSDSESDSESEGNGGKKLGKMFQPRGGSRGASHQDKSKRLTIKLRGLRSFREFGPPLIPPPSSPPSFLTPSSSSSTFFAPPSSLPAQGEDTMSQHIENIDVQETATQTQEEDMSPQHIEDIDAHKRDEDMSPQYIEDIDADKREEEMLALFRVDSHKGDRPTTG